MTLEIDSQPEIDRIKDKDLRLELKQWREKRSVDANGLLWACLTEIAHALGADKWDIYLQMLKRYGQHTYGVFTEQAVEAVKATWRESEIVGEIDVNGRKGIQMLLYYGSSMYDTKQFSILLDGVISEMAEMGLETPDERKRQEALDRWEEECRKRASSKAENTVSSAE